MTIEKERLIYTAGTFKIDDLLSQCRRLIVRTSVLRLPYSAIYSNERSNPSKYFLGYVSVFIGDYCYRIFPLEFEQQIVLLWDNLPSQVYARMLCEAINTTENLVALRTSIPLAGTLVPIPGQPGTFPGCPYTFIKFKLEPGARILVTGVGEEVESCEGGVFPSTVPDLTPPPDPYPNTQARDEDPARSLPEEGEKVGDTAPASEEDPDLGLAGVQCFRIRNKGILSGDIVFENFICAVTVYTEVGTPFSGQATVNIVAIGEGGVEVLRNNQASLASNPVEITPGADPGVRQPNFSFGNCDSCTV